MMEEEAVVVVDASADYEASTGNVDPCTHDWWISPSLLRIYLDRHERIPEATRNMSHLRRGGNTDLASRSSRSAIMSLS
jgi:hypothetical protein